MPTYQYRCKCGNEFEVQQSIHSKNLATCPMCKKETTHRLISKIGGFILKGTGWPGQDIVRRQEGN